MIRNKDRRLTHSPQFYLSSCREGLAVGCLDDCRKIFFMAERGQKVFLNKTKRWPQPTIHSQPFTANHPQRKNASWLWHRFCSTICTTRSPSVGSKLNIYINPLTITKLFYTTLALKKAFYFANGIIHNYMPSDVYHSATIQKPQVCILNSSVLYCDVSEWFLTVLGTSPSYSQKPSSTHNTKLQN